MTSLPVSDPTRLMSDLDFVRSLARYLCGDPHMADDIAQEALVTALERNPDTVRNWRGWLSTITRNLLFNKRRDEQRLKAHEQNAAADDTVPSAAEVAESEQVRRQVVSAVMQLPDDYRAVVLLRHYRGKTTKECAQQLNIPESTVRTRLQRAIEQLRGKLDTEHDGDRKKWMAALAPFALPVEPLAAPMSVVATANPKPLALAALAVVVLTGVTIGVIDAISPPAPPPATTTTATAAATPAPAPHNTPATEDELVQAPDEQRTTTSRGGFVFAGRTTIARSEEPIADAEVILTTDPWYHPDHDLRLTTKSGPDGRYEISLDPIREWSPLAQEQLRVEITVRAEGFITTSSTARLRKANSYMPETTIVIMDETIEPPVPTLKHSMVPGRSVHGRILTSAGVPVANARVAFADEGHAIVSRSDGTFDLTYTGGTRGLIAVHLQHGIATPLKIKAAGDVGDIALIHQLHQVRGQTVYPDGRPAPNQSLVLIKASSKPDELAFGGYSIAKFQHRFCLRRGSKAVSDTNGNFAFATLQPGQFTINVSPLQLGTSHEFKGLNREFNVPDGGNTPFLRIECPTGLVQARTVDSDGLVLSPQQCAYYTWPAEDAQRVEQQIRAGGITLPLLQSAAERTHAERNRHGIPGRPNTLIVAEVSTIGAAPGYGYCRLGPGEYSGVVDVVIETGRPPGSVQLPKVDQWTVVRACRMPVQGAVAIELPHLKTDGFTIGLVQSEWYFAPSNGVITGLPAGKAVLEVWQRGGPRQPFQFPNAQNTALHEVVVASNRTTKIEGPGTPIPDKFGNPRGIPEDVLENLRKRMKERQSK